MSPHEGQAGPGGGEFLPFIAGYFAEQRALAVDDFVMGDGQHKIFREGIHRRKGHLIVMPAPVDRFACDVVQRIVHPAHVPFEAEAEASGVGRMRNSRPCS